MHLSAFTVYLGLSFMLAVIPCPTKAANNNHHNPYELVQNKLHTIAFPASVQVSTMTDTPSHNSRNGHRHNDIIPRPTSTREVVGRYPQTGIPLPHLPSLSSGFEKFSPEQTTGTQQLHPQANSTSTALSPLESKYLNVTTDINIEPSNDGANSGTSPAGCKNTNDPSCDLGRGKGGINNDTSNATCLDKAYDGSYKGAFCQFWSQNGSAHQSPLPQVNRAGRRVTATLSAVIGFFVAVGIGAVITRLCYVGGGY